MTSWQHLDNVTWIPPFVPKTSFSWGLYVTFCLAPWAVVKRCSVQTCWQMPRICHTWLPCYNVPPRGGWQLFCYSHLAKDTRARMNSTPMLAEMLGCLKSSPECNPCRLTMAWVMPSCTAGRNMHGTALMTAQGSSSSLGPLPLIHMGGFQVSSFFDSEQLVSLTIILFTSKELWSSLRASSYSCLDDFVVAPPYSMGTIIDLFQLGLWPEATLSDVARGPYFLLELLAGRIDGYLLGVWTSEAVPCCWLGTRVSSTFLWVTAWIWLITTLVNIIPTGLYCRDSQSTVVPEALQPTWHRGQLQPWLHCRGYW